MVTLPVLSFVFPCNRYTTILRPYIQKYSGKINLVIGCALSNKNFPICIHFNPDIQYQLPYILKSSKFSFNTIYQVMQHKIVLLCNNIMITASGICYGRLTKSDTLVYTQYISITGIHVYNKYQQHSLHYIYHSMLASATCTHMETTGITYNLNIITTILWVYFSRSKLLCVYVSGCVCVYMPFQTSN